MATATLSKPRTRSGPPPIRPHRQQPPRTLREVLATSGVPVVAGLANQYGDGELEASHTALLDQASRWAGTFESDTLLGAL